MAENNDKIVIDINVNQGGIPGAAPFAAPSMPGPAHIATTPRAPQTISHDVLSGSVSSAKERVDRFEKAIEAKLNEATKALESTGNLGKMKYSEALRKKVRGQIIPDEKELLAELAQFTGQNYKNSSVVNDVKEQLERAKIAVAKMVNNQLSALTGKAIEGIEKSMASGVNVELGNLVGQGRKGAAPEGKSTGKGLHAVFDKLNRQVMVEAAIRFEMSVGRSLEDATKDLIANLQADSKTGSPLVAKRSISTRKNELVKLAQDVANKIAKESMDSVSSEMTSSASGQKVSLSKVSVDLTGASTKILAAAGSLDNAASRINQSAEKMHEAMTGVISRLQSMPIGKGGGGDTETHDLANRAKTDAAAAAIAGTGGNIAIPTAVMSSSRVAASSAAAATGTSPELLRRTFVSGGTESASFTDQKREIRRAMEARGAELQASAISRGYASTEHTNDMTKVEAAAATLGLGTGKLTDPKILDLFNATFADDATASKSIDSIMGKIKRGTASVSDIKTATRLVPKAGMFTIARSVGQYGGAVDRGIRQGMESYDLAPGQVIDEKGMALVELSQALANRAISTIHQQETAIKGIGPETLNSPEFKKAFLDAFTKHVAGGALGGVYNGKGKSASGGAGGFFTGISTKDAVLNGSIPEILTAAWGTKLDRKTLGSETDMFGRKMNPADPGVAGYFQAARTHLSTGNVSGLSEMSKAFGIGLAHQEMTLGEALKTDKGFVLDSGMTVKEQALAMSNPKFREAIGAEVKTYASLKKDKEVEESKNADIAADPVKSQNLRNAYAAVAKLRRRPGFKKSPEENFSILNEVRGEEATLLARLAEGEKELNKLASTLMNLTLRGKGAANPETRKELRNTERQIAELESLIQSLRQQKNDPKYKKGKGALGKKIEEALGKKAELFEKKDTLTARSNVEATANLDKALLSVRNAMSEQESANLRIGSKVNDIRSLAKSIPVDSVAGVDYALAESAERRKELYRKHVKDNPNPYSSELGAELAGSVVDVLGPLTKDSHIAPRNKKAGLRAAMLPIGMFDPRRQDAIHGIYLAAHEGLKGNVWTGQVGPDGMPIFKEASAESKQMIMDQAAEFMRNPALHEIVRQSSALVPENGEDRILAKKKSLGAEGDELNLTLPELYERKKAQEAKAKEKLRRTQADLAGAKGTGVRESSLRKRGEQENRDLEKVRSQLSAFNRLSNPSGNPDEWYTDPSGKSQLRPMYTQREFNALLVRNAIKGELERPEVLQELKTSLQREEEVRASLGGEYNKINERNTRIQTHHMKRADDGSWHKDNPFSEEDTNRLLAIGEQRKAEIMGEIKSRSSYMTAFHDANQMMERERESLAKTGRSSAGALPGYVKKGSISDFISGKTEQRVEGKTKLQQSRVRRYLRGLLSYIQDGRGQVIDAMKVPQERGQISDQENTANMLAAATSGYHALYGGATDVDAQRKAGLSITQGDIKTTEDQLKRVDEAIKTTKAKTDERKALNTRKRELSRKLELLKDAEMTLYKTIYGNDFEKTAIKLPQQANRQFGTPRVSPRFGEYLLPTDARISQEKLAVDTVNGVVADEATMLSSLDKTGRGEALEDEAGRRDKRRLVAAAVDKMDEKKAIKRRRVKDIGKAWEMAKKEERAREKAYLTSENAEKAAREAENERLRNDPNVVVREVGALIKGDLVSKAAGASALGDQEKAELRSTLSEKKSREGMTWGSTGPTPQYIVDQFLNGEKLPFTKGPNVAPIVVGKLGPVEKKADLSAIEKQRIENSMYGGGAPPLIPGDTRPVGTQPEGEGGGNPPIPPRVPLSMMSGESGVLQLLRLIVQNTANTVTELQMGKGVRMGGAAADPMLLAAKKMASPKDYFKFMGQQGDVTFEQAWAKYRNTAKKAGVEDITKNSLWAQKNIIGAKDSFYNSAGESRLSVEQRAMPRSGVDQKKLGASLAFGANISGADEKFAQSEGALTTTMRRVLMFGGTSMMVYKAVGALQQFGATVVNMDKQLADLRKTLGGTDADFAKLADTAIQTAKETGTPTQSVLDSTELFSKQFKRPEDLAILSKSAALFSNLSGQSVAASVETITSAIEQYNLSVSQAGRLTDSWAQMAANANVTTKDLGDAFGAAGGAAKEAGLTVDQLNAIVTTISASTGKTGKDIGTGLKRMFERVASPENEKKLAKAGIATRQIGIDKEPEARNFLDIIRDIQMGRDEQGNELVKGGKGWDEMSSSQKRHIAVLIAGARQYDAFIALMNNFKKTQELVTLSQNSDGQAMEQNQRLMATLTKRFTVMKDEIDSVARTVGKVLVPVFGSLVGVLTSLIGTLAKAPGLLIGLSSLGALKGLSGMGNLLLRGTVLGKRDDGYEYFKNAKVGSFFSPFMSSGPSASAKYGMGFADSSRLSLGMMASGMGYDFLNMTGLSGRLSGSRFEKISGVGKAALAREELRAGGSIVTTGGAAINMMTGLGTGMLKLAVSAGILWAAWEVGSRVLAWSAAQIKQKITDNGAEIYEDTNQATIKSRQGMTARASYALRAEGVKMELESAIKNNALTPQTQRSLSETLTGIVDDAVKTNPEADKMFSRNLSGQIDMNSGTVAAINAFIALTELLNKTDLTKNIQEMKEGLDALRQNSGKIGNAPMSTSTSAVGAYGYKVLDSLTSSWIKLWTDPARGFFDKLFWSVALAVQESALLAFHGIAPLFAEKVMGESRTIDVEASTGAVLSAGPGGNAGARLVAFDKLTQKQKEDFLAEKEYVSTSGHKQHASATASATMLQNLDNMNRIRKGYEQEVASSRVAWSPGIEESLKKQGLRSGSKEFNQKLEDELNKKERELRSQEIEKGYKEYMEAHPWMDRSKLSPNTRLEIEAPYMKSKDKIKDDYKAGFKYDEEKEYNRTRLFRAKISDLEPQRIDYELNKSLTSNYRNATTLGAYKSNFLQNTLSAYDTAIMSLNNDIGKAAGPEEELAMKLQAGDLASMRDRRDKMATKYYGLSGKSGGAIKKNEEKEAAIQSYSAEETEQLKKIESIQKEIDARKTHSQAIQEENAERAKLRDSIAQLRDVINTIVVLDNVIRPALKSNISSTLQRGQTMNDADLQSQTDLDYLDKQIARAKELQQTNGTANTAAGRNELRALENQKIDVKKNLAKTLEANDFTHNLVKDTGQSMFGTTTGMLTDQLFESGYMSMFGEAGKGMAGLNPVANLLGANNDQQYQQKSLLYLSQIAQNTGRDTGSAGAVGQAVSSLGQALGLGATEGGSGFTLGGLSSGQAALAGITAAGLGAGAISSGGLSAIDISPAEINDLKTSAAMGDQGAMQALASLGQIDTTKPEGKFGKLFKGKGVGMIMGALSGAAMGNQMTAAQGKTGLGGTIGGALGSVAGVLIGGAPGMAIGGLLGGMFGALFDKPKEPELKQLPEIEEKQLKELMKINKNLNTVNETMENLINAPSNFTLPIPKGILNNSITAQSAIATPLQSRGLVIKSGQAYLHAGERVTDGNPMSGGSVNVSNSFVIQGANKDPREIADEVAGILNRQTYNNSQRIGGYRGRF